MEAEHVTRMRNEHTELVDRMLKLSNFLWSPVFDSLAEQDRQLLIEQYAHMKGYERALAERITRS